MFLCCVYDRLGSLAVTVSIGLRALFFRTVATIGVVAAEVRTVLLSSTVAEAITNPRFGPAFAGGVAVSNLTSRAFARFAVCRT